MDVFCLDYELGHINPVKRGKKERFYTEDKVQTSSSMGLPISFNSIEIMALFKWIIGLVSISQYNSL